MNPSSEQEKCAWLCHARIENHRDKNAPWLQHFAVWARDAEHAKELLTRSTQNLEEPITHVIAIAEASTIDDAARQTLANRVGSFVFIAFGPREPLTQQRLDDYDNTDYLSISKHNIPPLAEQSGVAFWNKEWITPELKNLLFEQPNTSIAANAETSHENKANKQSNTHLEQTCHTFLVVDATLRRNITKFFDLGGNLGVPIQCLFSGKAAQELAEVAPLLNRYDPPQRGMGQ